MSVASNFTHASSKHYDVDVKLFNGYIQEYLLHLNSRIFEDTLRGDSSEHENKPFVARRLRDVAKWQYNMNTLHKQIYTRINIRGYNRFF